MSDFCKSGTLADPTYFTSAQINTNLGQTSDSGTAISIKYLKIDAQGYLTNEATTPPAIAVDGTDPSICNNIATTFELTYEVTEGFKLLKPVLTIFWRESFTFSNSWFKFTYSFIPKPVLPTTTTTTETTESQLKNIVASTGNIGYNLFDYVIFGQNVRSSTNEFLGVRVETPVSSFRFKDIYGNCLDYSDGKETFSEETELLSLGKSKIMSCRFRTTTANQVSNRCNKLEIQSKFFLKYFLFRDLFETECYIKIRNC